MRNDEIRSEDIILPTDMPGFAPEGAAAGPASEWEIRKLDDIVTMTVFITDMANGTRFTQLRKEFFKEGSYPASALIGIKELARPEMMIEIQAIAVVD